jgi:hypothetical protein
MIIINNIINVKIIKYLKTLECKLTWKSNPSRINFFFFFNKYIIFIINKEIIKIYDYDDVFYYCRSHIPVGRSALWGQMMLFFKVFPGPVSMC